MNSPLILIIPAAIFLSFVIYMWNEKGPKFILQFLFAFGFPVVLVIITGNEWAFLAWIPCLLLVGEMDKS